MVKKAKSKFWSGEKIFSLTAMGISLMTLFVFGYQTRLIQKQQYMSVYPHLSLKNMHSGALDYELVLTNDGIGPAIIKKIELAHDNGKSYSSLKEYVYSEIKEEDSLNIHNTDIYEGLLIPAKEKITLFGLMTEEYAKRYEVPLNTLKGSRKLHSIINNPDINFKITYESIYGEEWTIGNKSLIPTKK